MHDQGSIQWGEGEKLPPQTPQLPSPKIPTAVQITME